MGTHPIFESDFDCLTEYARRAHARTFCHVIKRMKASKLFVLFGAALATENGHRWQPEGANYQALCGYCADNAPCDVKTGKCPAGCATGYSEQLRVRVPLRQLGGRRLLLPSRRRCQGCLHGPRCYDGFDHILRRTSKLLDERPETRINLLFFYSLLTIATHF